MGRVSRRKFLGTVGAATGVTGTAHAARSTRDDAKQATATYRGLRDDIRALVDKTPFIDTHEHLWAEARRIEALAKPDPNIAAADFGMLLCHYADSDLQVAGLSGDDYKRLVSHDLSVREKWKLVQPWYDKCRNTGYLLCARESARILFGEEDLDADTCVRVSEKLAAGVKPGYYRHVLREVANIAYCQVNSLDAAIFDKDQPDPELLAQDISTVSLSTGLGLDTVRRVTGRDITTLDDMHGAIDWCFDTFGPRAIATKNQCAYSRPLDFAKVTDEEAAPLMARRTGLDDAEKKALQDHLMHYCIRKATEKGLPVKLHTGYFAGYNRMPLEWLRRHASDLCPLVMEYPETKFVLMHIGYPYQDEPIAMAKQFSNVYIDMCWAWIINPAASVRFLKEFIMAAPASKIFTFGGDFRPVENVVGHAAIARRGIVRAVSELVEEGWLPEDDVPALVERIMNGNAREVFPYERALKNWRNA